MNAPGDVEQLRAFFASGGSLCMLNDTSPEAMDTLWRYACQLLQQGNAAGARNLLEILVYSDSWNSDYLLTQGVACQQTGAHDDALLFLAQAARILVVDPRPGWLMAQSAIALSRWDCGEALLTSVVALAGQRPEYRSLVDTASKQLSYCQKMQAQGEQR